MIWTVCQISIQRLWNNKQELVLALVVPVLFFTIFALIFSRGVGQSLSRVQVIFVDDDQTEESSAVIRQACQRSEIKANRRIVHTPAEWPTEMLARWLISKCHADVVVHIPQGFTTQDPAAPSLSIALYNQGINPIGHRLVEACLAESIAMALSEASLAKMSTPESGVQLASATSVAFSQPGLSLPTDKPASAAAPQVFQTIDAFANNKHDPKIASYAAGIAVMFLLFGANAAGASLLEERETGTLARLLSSRLSLTELLLGKWLFVTALGCVQLSIMFGWAQLVFRVDLLGHFSGFALMTVATSAACASFGIFLATLCRSRQQLHGVSIVLVLSMSAVGGSMVPRYIMSDSMKFLGKFTFNGWALDGYQKIFWYDLPPQAIQLELAVLIGITLVLGLTSVVLAHRWSSP